MLRSLISTGSALSSRTGRLGTRELEFKRVGLTVMIQGTLRKAKLQLDIFELFDRQPRTSQPILEALDCVLQVDYVRVQGL